MGWKEFAASVYATTLSWPVAIVVVVIVFYRPLKGLIGRVRSGKVGGVEFEIREELREADAAARNAEKQARSSDRRGESSTSPLNPEAPDGSREAADPTDGMSEVEAVVYDDLSAADGIESSYDQMHYVWGRLEDALRRLYSELVSNTPGFFTVDRAARILAKGGALDDDFVDSVTSLRSVLDDVSTTGFASHSTARKFTRTAARLHGIVEKQIVFYKR